VAGIRGVVYTENLADSCEPASFIRVCDSDICQKRIRKPCIAKRIFGCGVRVLGGRAVSGAFSLGDETAHSIGNSADYGGGGAAGTGYREEYADLPSHAVAPVTFRVAAMF